MRKEVIHPDFLAVKEMDYIYFPLVKKARISEAKIVNTKFKFPEKPRPLTIETILNKKLTAEQLKLIPKSQEIVGSIMILEIPPQLIKEEKLIAEAYLQINRNIETIVQKNRIHSGEFRTRKVKILAGRKSKETIHFENGVKIKLHLELVYFSARSAGERLRLAREIKKGEEVLIMFSGAAPFPLVIAKNSDAKKVYGVELNPFGYSYGQENVVLNKLEKKIKLFEGDVRLVIPKLKKKFDRIAMPLPKTGKEFLDIALPRVKNGGMIHLYVFLDEKDIFEEAKRVRELCKNLGYLVRVIGKVKCGQFSPGIFRVCFDLKVLKKK